LEEAERLYPESVVVKCNLVTVLSKLIQTPENMHKRNQALARLQAAIDSVMAGEVDFHVPSEVIEFKGKTISLYAKCRSGEIPSDA
jgi:hypothetical protein